MARSGDGGGIAVSADSTVNLAATVVTISHNIAEHRGGGLFFDASLQQQSNATSCGLEKVVFWRLDLVANTARKGDGGAIFSASNINLHQGGQTNATGNTAKRGGAIALSDATITVQSKHTLIAQHNVAKTDGGAIALLSGAVCVCVCVRVCVCSSPPLSFFC